jgi:hypothetical protein
MLHFNPNVDPEPFVGAYSAAMANRDVRDNRDPPQVRVQNASATELQHISPRWKQETQGSQQSLRECLHEDATLATPCT